MDCLTYTPPAVTGARAALCGDDREAWALAAAGHQHDDHAQDTDYRATQAQTREHRREPAHGDWATMPTDVSAPTGRTNAHLVRRLLTQ